MRFGLLLEIQVLQLGPPFTMKSRVTPYSFWAVTSLRTAPLRFHSPYSAISDLSLSSPISIAAAPPGNWSPAPTGTAVIPAAPGPDARTGGAGSGARTVLR